MNSVFYSVEPAGTIISIGAHGGVREESNPDRNQPPTSLGTDSNCPSLSAPIVTNQGKETNTGLVCVHPGDRVSESGTCEFFICTV